MQQYLIIFTGESENNVFTTNWFSLEMYGLDELNSMVVIDLHAGKQLVGSKVPDGEFDSEPIWGEIKEDHL